MQFWQQQLMYKQLQELQRQQQLQQLNQGGRQQNSLSQLSSVVKPLAVNQLPATMNDVVTSDASNYMWPNSFVGSLPTVPGNSQMFVAGNMNWVQSSSSAINNVSNGLMLSNDENHAMRPMGFTNQQLDQSFSGMPVSNSKSSMTQYTQFSGLSNDCNNLMTKAVGNHAEKPLDPVNSFQNDQHFSAQGCFQDRNSVVTQNFQQKGLFGNASSEILNSEFTSGNFQQANNLQLGMQAQEVNGRQEQADWLGSLQEKPPEQVGTTGGVASLDPTEEKILFGSDDDGNWGAAFSGSLNSSSGGYLNGLPVGNDYFGGFPSIQSGSWSALMQEAVQASSSDKGLQEEWSGLDFQKIEQSTVKHSVVSSESGKQLADWNDANMQNTSSISKPLPLFNDTDPGPNSYVAPNFRHSFGSALEENSRVRTDAPHTSFQLSSSDANIEQFHQSRKQKQFSEGSLQAQMPETNGTWADQAYVQQGNSSDMQSIEGGWTHQQSMQLSNVARQPSNRSLEWDGNYSVEPGRVSSANFPDDDGNIWRLGGSHVVPNGRVQQIEPDIANSQVQNEDAFVGNNSQQILFGKTFAVNSSVNSKGDESVGRNQNQPSRGPPTWEPSARNFDDRLSDRLDQSKGHQEVISGERYVSNDSNLGQHRNSGDGTKESSAFTGYDQNPFIRGNQKSSSLSGQQAFAPHFFQDQMSSLRMNVEPSFPTNHLTHLQGLPNSVSRGFKSEEQMQVGKPNFNGHVASNINTDTTKGFVMGPKELQSRDAIPMNVSTSGVSTAHYSQNKNIAQTSQNMLELLHKVDQSRNSNAMAAAETTAQANTTSQFNQPPATQGFGLRLAPPSYRQQLPLFALPSQTLNDGKSRQFNQEAGDKDQTWPISTSSLRTHSTNEASQRENLSNRSGEKHQEASEVAEQVNSLSASSSDNPYVGQQQQHILSGRNQMLQQHQRKHFSGLTGHDALDQSVNFVVNNQANVSLIGKNNSVLRQPRNSHDGAVAGHSIETSFSTPTAGVPASRVAPFADTSAPSNSKSSSAETENSSRMIPGFSQVPNSGSFTDARRALQPSTPGMSQQVGLSNMLHNVWTNISAQQRLAGLQPHKVTPQILQSIINNSRDTSLWGLKEQDDQGSKGEHTPESNANYADSRNDEHLSKGSSLRSTYPEKVGSASKTGIASQGPELARKTPSDGGSNVSIPSLVCLHQQDVDKGKGGHDPGFRSQGVHAPNTSFASSSSDVGCSGRTSVPSNVQQHNYSLLHQMQVMKNADSDPSGQRLKGVDFSSSSSQVDWNTEQKYTYGQSPGTSVPADGKASLNPQSSFPADMKMLSFVSKGDEEKNSSTPHDLQDQMHTLRTNSAANLIGGSDRTKISPQMAPSWFEKYGTYRNGTIVSTKFDTQWSAKHATHPYFLPKVPRTMEYSTVVDQRNGSSQFGTDGQSTLPVTMTAHESPSGIMLPGLVDHGMIQSSKKRKSLTLELVPWHKMVTQSPRKLRSISTAEFDWSQATNRLIEKVYDEAETIDDVPSKPQSRRRLILTTQLLQQLLPALPARMLKVEAAAAYDSVTFYVAKSVLADACSLISSVRDSCVHLENENTTSEKLKPSEDRDRIFSKLVEDFVVRAKKLENEFLRLDKRTSVLDVRLDCQELERISIVNRLGKFHGRSNADGIESSSRSETATRKIFPQRYVTALSVVPGSLPEGVFCLSL